MHCCISFFFPRWQAAPRTPEDLAGRILALEQFLATEKVEVQPTTADDWVYTGISKFVSGHPDFFRQPGSRGQLCTFLKNKRVKSSAVERYRATAETGGVQ